MIDILQRQFVDCTFNVLFYNLTFGTYVVMDGLKFLNTYSSLCSYGKHNHSYNNAQH